MSNNSKSLSKQRPRTLYKEKDFKAASRNDRFYMCILEPKMEAYLPDRDRDYFSQLKACFVLCAEEVSQSVAIKKIQNTLTKDGRNDSAHKLYKDMCEVYGKITKRNKAFAKVVLVEKLYALAALAEQNVSEKPTPEELDIVAKIYERAAKIEGLDKEETLFDAQEITIPEIHITNDPKYIIESIDDEQDEEADFEFLPNEEGENEEDLFS